MHLLQVFWYIEISAIYFMNEIQVCQFCSLVTWNSELSEQIIQIL